MKEKTNGKDSKVHLTVIKELSKQNNNGIKVPQQISRPEEGKKESEEKDLPKVNFKETKRFFTTIRRQLGDNSFNQKSNSNQQETRTQNKTSPIGGQGRWSGRGRATPRVTAPCTDTTPTTGRGGGSIPVYEAQQQQRVGNNSFNHKTNSNKQGNIYASQGGEENNKTQNSNPTHRSPQRTSHSDESDIWSQAEAKQPTTRENKDTRTQNKTLPIGGQGRWSCRGRARPRVTAPDTDTAPTTGRGGGSIPVDETQQEQRVGKP